MSKLISELLPAYRPLRSGPEKLTIDERGATALSGTGFNEDSLQHRIGSDAARYAIRIQQARDDKDYQHADAWKEFSKSFGYIVMQDADSTTVLPASDSYRALSQKEKKSAALPKAVIGKGILYDV